MEFKYTDEKNVLLLVALLKANGIKHVIVSPGTTNFTFVASLQNDDFFQLFSCVDERSAAYMACGMAAETGKPVVITCTGATASRNYLPGLTEAYYRKLPVMAVCGHRGISAIGHLQDQQIDRRNEPVDVAKEQVWLPFVKDDEDERLCYNEITKAILALSIHGGGPVIINLCTHYSQNLSIQKLPDVKNVNFYRSTDNFPSLPHGRIAITLGSHRIFTQEETEIIDAFCAQYDAVVFCDHTSGFKGKYAVLPGLIMMQEESSNLCFADICVNAGEISGDTGIGYVWAHETWRISEDGVYRNRTNNVTKIFEMSLAQFCKQYLAKEITPHSNFLQACNDAYQDVYSNIPELPFSNIWIAQQISNKIPPLSNVYFGILGSLRSWGFFKMPYDVKGFSNVGGYGIDGTISSAIGQAITSPDKLVFCILGDLAFFYDMNSLGNRHVGNNLRILLINNGLGDEFRMYDNPTGFMGESVRPYISAEGHYSHMSRVLVKSYAESLGYKYLTADNKSTFRNVIQEFIDPTIEQSIIFEVFIRPEDDTDSLDMIKHIKRHIEKKSLKKKIKSAVKNVIGEERIKAFHTIIGK